MPGAITRHRRISCIRGRRRAARADAVHSAQSRNAPAYYSTYSFHRGADWLIDDKRSTDLARFILRLLPEALAALETSGLNSFIGRRILTQIQSIDLAPLAAGTLRTFVSEGRHRGFLDELLLAVHETLNRPETMEAIRQKIRNELPTLLKLYRADSYLMKKIAASATAFFDEVRTDPDHPFRDRKST